MKKSLETLNEAEPATTMTCVVSFTSVLMPGVAACLTGHSLNWYNDAAFSMLARTILLGGGVVFRVGEMVNVDILVGKFPAAP